MLEELRTSLQIYDAGFDGLPLLHIKSKEKQLKDAKKVIKKYYPTGIVPFDSGIFDLLFEKEDQNEEKRRKVIEALHNAKSGKNTTLYKQYKKELKKLNLEKAEIKRDMKKAVDQNSIYNRAAKPYLDAKKLLIQKENYSHYDEIKERYEESKARAEKERAQHEEALRREAEEKEILAARKREERKAAKAKK